MKIAYLDLIGGISGDIFLGALLDAGLPAEVLHRLIPDLRLEGVELRVQQVLKNGLRATQVEVLVAADVPERRLAELQAIVRQGNLEADIKEKACAILQRLGEVEAGIHGLPVEEVHLHELGGLDTVVDVVGALVGLAGLGIGRVFASPVPLGRGFTRSAHGPLPLPAPATIALLKGAPLVGRDLDVELVTPTGAALLAELVESYGPLPAMRLQAVGYGAGKRDLPIPNVLRLLVGEPVEPLFSRPLDAPTSSLSAQGSQGEGVIIETLAVIETNIDDLNPELYDYILARLFSAGALDVALLPIHMKKNRPAVQLQALCRLAEAEALTAILFAETSTLGVRQHLVERRALPRSIQTVQTPYGAVRVKVASWGEGRSRLAPEYEDCRRLAEERQVPLWEVYRAAESLAARLSDQGG